MDLGLITVICGGNSFEQNVSRNTGKFIFDNIPSKFKKTLFDFDGNLSSLVAHIELAKPSAIINALHGGSGENGQVQAVFEMCKIPYSHSGVFSSAAAMDKMRSKMIYEGAGIPTAKAKIVSSTAEIVADELTNGAVLKPVSDGSSNNIFLLKTMADVEKLPSTFKIEMMLEEYVVGREFTVGVRDNGAIAITEVIIGEIYGYDDKYVDNKTRHIINPDLPPQIEKAIREISVAAHNSLDCKGVSRTDIRWDEAKGIAGIFVLETNTQPGMRPQALIVEQFNEIGMSFEDMCEWIILDCSLDR